MKTKTKEAVTLSASHKIKEGLGFYLLKLETEVQRARRNGLEAKVEISNLKTKFSVYIWISIPVDELKLQKDLGYDVENGKKFDKLQRQIREVSGLSYIEREAKTRSERKRVEIVKEVIEEFFSVAKELLQSRESRLKKIGELQKKQKEIIRRRREKNAKVIEAMKEEKREWEREWKENIEKGKFEEVDDDFLKKYFSPNLSKKCIVGKSNRWRAVLFAEVDYVRAMGLCLTGRFALCGVDDNGEEWEIPIFLQNEGFEVSEAHVSEAPSIEKVMAEIWRVSVKDVKSPDTRRQGDVLIVKAEKKEKEEYPEKAKEISIAESHLLVSEEIYADTSDISRIQVYVPHSATLKHTSHQDVVLGQGHYSLILPRERD